MATRTALELPVHRFDTVSYNEMVASGSLEDRRIELVEGVLVEMMSPHSPEHASVVRRLARHLAAAEGWLQVQLPLEVPPDSVPEPDLAVLAEEPPPGRHPRSALLAVEVAATSRRVDRSVKAALYARAGVPTYWLVDLVDRTVEVRVDPGPDGYRRCDVYGSGAAVPSPLAGVAELDLDSLLEGVGA